MHGSKVRTKLELDVISTKVLWISQFPSGIIRLAIVV